MADLGAGSNRPTPESDRGTGSVGTQGIVSAGVRAYIAALDFHHARVFGRREATTGLARFERLAEQVMTALLIRIYWESTAKPFERNADAGNARAPGGI